MTPITLTRQSVFSSMMSTDVMPDPASQPLLFAPAPTTISAASPALNRRCTNKDVLSAVIEALADKTRSSQCIANIFINAYLNNYQSDLNAVIKNIETQHGAGTVLINTHVKRILADGRIDLHQNDDGTVHLQNIILKVSNLEMQNLITTTLEPILPTALCKLIVAYADEIEICAQNRADIIAILESDDPAAKSLLIAAASHQDKILFLNGILRRQSRKRTLNFVNVDLSNLDLTGIDLSRADVRFANLQNCCLINEKLVDASLCNANLNGANLTGADLSNATLT